MQVPSLAQGLEEGVNHQERAFVEAFLDRELLVNCLLSFNNL